MNRRKGYHPQPEMSYEDRHEGRRDRSRRGNPDRYVDFYEESERHDMDDYHHERRTRRERHHNSPPPPIREPYQEPRKAAPIIQPPKIEDYDDMLEKRTVYAASAKHDQNHIDISKFWVIAIVSNPIRFSSRYKLFKQFQQHMADLGAKMIVVEQAFGTRPFEITNRNNPRHVQVRTQHELWLKENMINLGVNYLTQLDPDWEYVAWIDGDVNFQRNDIIEETCHQLQHYDFVQMFSHAIDMGPDMNPLKIQNGFMWSYINNGCMPPQGCGHGGYYGGQRGQFWHPGFAWAARRRVFEKINLFDKAILGAGDHHMALAMIGQAERSYPKGLTKEYREAVMNWQGVVECHCNRNVGYVPGTLTHYWHGTKANRKYSERWKILIDNKFNPTTDITRDSQGLYRLNDYQAPRYIRLRDDIRAYFRQRQEDCTFNDDPGLPGRVDP